MYVCLFVQFLPRSRNCPFIFKRLEGQKTIVGLKVILRERYVENRLITDAFCGSNRCQKSFFRNHVIWRFA